MYINNTTSTLVIGRFYVLPGEKLSPLPKSATEEEQIQRLVKNGFLVVKEQPKPKAQPKPAEQQQPKQSEQQQPKPAEQEKK